MKEEHFSKPIQADYTLEAESFIIQTTKSTENGILIMGFDIVFRIYLDVAGPVLD